MVDNRPFYQKIQNWVDERQKQDNGQADGLPEPTMSSTDDAASFGRSGFGTHFDLNKYLGTLNEREMLDRCMCGICFDIASEPQITDCKHVFCKSCIQKECIKAAANNRDFAECPTCQFAFGEVVPYTDLGPREKPIPTPVSANEAGSSSRRKGKEKPADEDWLGMEGAILPSTKLTAVKVWPTSDAVFPDLMLIGFVKAQILEWFKVAPDDKIIIYTQFHLV